MQLFYGSEHSGNTISLTGQESKHCHRVLRMRVGDQIWVTNGEGHIYHGDISSINDERVDVNIHEMQTVSPLPYRLHLYVAMTKQSDRIEWMLEKAVEMGISSFTPIITQRGERKKIREDRLKAIAISAMKQSNKGWLPHISPVRTFEDALLNCHTDQRLIAHCDHALERSVLSMLDTQDDIGFFIGPEGDFTKDEISFARSHNFTSVDLGFSRLRTETAGVLAVSWAYLKHINLPLI